MPWLMYSMEWFVVIMLLISTLMNILVFYRQPGFHNRQTLFAIFALSILTLVALLLTLAQARSVIGRGLHTYFLFMALFFLMTTVTQSGIFSSAAKGRGWRIYRIGLAVFSIGFALFAVVIYLYNL